MNDRPDSAGENRPATLIDLFGTCRRITAEGRVMGFTVATGSRTAGKADLPHPGA